MLSFLTNEHITLIISFFISLIGAGAFWEFVKSLVEKRKEKIGMINGLETLHEVYDVMQEMIKLGAERVVLFAGHNQGGIPRPTCGFWVTALHGTIKNNNPQKIDYTDFKNIKVDLHYIEMLLDIQNRGHILIKTKDMPSCSLKDIYESENISEAIIMFLGIKEKKFIYVSAAKFQKNHFSREEITKIVLKGERLKNLIE